MTITIQPVERGEWRTLVPAFRDYNYRQLWDFGVACARRVGAVSEHVAIRRDNEVIGLADVRIKHIPLMGTGVAYVNGGPLVRSVDPSSDSQRLRTVLARLADHYGKSRKLVLRIQPPPVADDWNDVQRKIFQDSGYDNHGRRDPYRTIILDICPPLEVLRKRLDQKWRNCLNNAEKRRLAVKIGSDENLFSTFLHLYHEMTARKHFHVDLPPEFYLQVQKELSDQERFLVSIIYENDQPIAGHVSSILGCTCVYLLGATTDVGLKSRAAYLVQWSVIQAAKDKGCHWYDLGGIDPEGNPGVYHFKKGMGGIDVTAPGPFEVAPNFWSGAAVGAGERLYRWYSGASARKSVK